MERKYTVCVFAHVCERRGFIHVLTQECAEVLNDLVGGLTETTLDTEVDKLRQRYSRARLQLNIVFTLKMV